MDTRQQSEARCRVIADSPTVAEKTERSKVTTQRARPNNYALKSTRTQYRFYNHKRMYKEKSKASNHDSNELIFDNHCSVFLAFVSKYCCQKMQENPIVTIEIDKIIIVFMYLLWIKCRSQ